MQWSDSRERSEAVSWGQVELEAGLNGEQAMISVGDDRQCELPRRGQHTGVKRGYLSMPRERWPGADPVGV